MAGREEESVIRSICDNLDVAIHIVGRDMKIIYANKYWDKLTRGNLQSANMVGKSLYELFPFLLERGVDQEYKQVFETGNPLITEEATEYQGELIHTRTKKLPIKDAHGNVQYVITVIQDITEDAQLRETLHRKLSEISTVLEIDRLLIITPDVDRVVKLATSRVHELLNADRTVFSLFDKSTNVIKPVAVEGLYKRQILALTLKPGDGFTGKVILSRKGAILNDAHLSDIAMEVPDTPPVVESLLCVPLIFKDEVLGALTISRMGEGKHFTDDDLNFCEIIAAQVAIALQNARLHGQLKQLVDERTKELQAAYDNLKALERERREYVSKIMAEVTPTLNIIRDCVSTLLVDKAARQHYDKILNRIRDKLDILAKTINKLTKAEGINK
ncbi:hypothetical protein CGW93_01205 [candidate division bacterium WOR-3 4484_18]|uniref:PAC domain-containing protein n=1 Tax=candidate division WOR-3 bacterium 4484_18 TaxID=2020626 RepID=A0A257LUW9_UNCW3|nr:MAG: hypothetical protein CGW93_01205 [candidate division bacterium WOR-3 4484_18]